MEPPHTHELNQPIVDEEILDAVKSLKTGKASGIDGISNEMICDSISLFTKVYTRAFNYIFNLSAYPCVWKKRAGG